MKRKRFILPFVLVATFAAASCSPKPAVEVQPTPFTSSVRAADDIASSIKIMISAESNVEQQKLISPQEGLTIINGVGALHAANVQYTADLGAAIASGNKSALPAAAKALRNAANNLQDKGLLGLKSEKAKQIFAVAMSSVTIALAVIEGFVSSP